MSGNYLFQKPYWAALQRVIDAAGGLVFGLRRPRKMPSDVKKILVARIDHLGDVFLASSILPHLRSTYPSAKIHFLAGEWAHDYLRANPYIDNILVYNSIRLNRSTGGFFKNAGAAVSGFLRNVREMRKDPYDLCIDLRAYPFNAIVLMSLGGGRYRVGFPTGGFAFLLDKTVPYRVGVHETSHIRDVLDAIGIRVGEGDLKPEFVPSRGAQKECARILEGLGVADGERFVLIHTGSGTPAKLWNRERWQDLIKQIVRRYAMKVVVYDPVYGDSSLKGCIKLPPLISLEQFAAAAKKASLFIGLDSMPAHLSASFGTPTVVIWCGINAVAQWRPVGESVRVVRRSLECSPCHRKNGCASMSCMDISADECMEEAAFFLDRFGPPRAKRHIAIV